MSRVIVQVGLLSGRYHAHPWGEAQHAMAGPEWPPSPWRLLRGLAAAWFDASPPPTSAAERDELLQELGRAAPPSLWLPPVSFAEIPYYQPITASRKQIRVLHFDHFAVLSESAAGAFFCFEFKVDLSPRQQNSLRLLLARITYFGRAESRAHLSLVEDLPGNLTKVSAADGRLGPGDVRRRVLVTRKSFSPENLWSSESGRCHLVQRMIEEGRKCPPNTEWVDYSLPAWLVRHQLAFDQIVASGREQRVAAVQFGLFRRVPIQFQELVRVAREIRDQAASRFKMETGEISRRLTGREVDGSIARGHQHAFWLPVPDRETTHIRKCTVWLPSNAGSFNQRELDALLGIQRLFSNDDYPILTVVERVNETVSGLKASRAWKSLTPYLPPRHSRRGRRDLEPSEQLRKTVEEITGASPMVRAMRGPRSLGRLTTVRTHYYERDSWNWTKRAASWFRLEFDAPITIPRPVGSDAHFGLGQFVPADDREE